MTISFRFFIEIEEKAYFSTWRLHNLAIHICNTLSYLDPTFQANAIGLDAQNAGAGDFVPTRIRHHTIQISNISMQLKGQSVNFVIYFRWQLNNVKFLSIF